MGRAPPRPARIPDGTNRRFGLFDRLSSFTQIGNVWSVNAPTVEGLATALTCPGPSLCVARARLQGSITGRHPALARTYWRETHREDHRDCGRKRLGAHPPMGLCAGTFGVMGSCGTLRLGLLRRTAAPAVGLVKRARTDKSPERRSNWTNPRCARRKRRLWFKDKIYSCRGV